MKEVKVASLSSDSNISSFDRQGIIKAKTRRTGEFHGLTEFLRMTGVDSLKITSPDALGYQHYEFKSSDPIKEPTEEDLFKNLSDNLKEVYQKIN